MATKKEKARVPQICEAHALKRSCKLENSFQFVLDSEVS